MDTKSYNYQKSDSPRNKKNFIFIILSCLVLSANVGQAQNAILLKLPENTKEVVQITRPPGWGSSSLSILQHDYRLFEIKQNGVLSFKDEYIPDYEMPRNSQGVVDLGADQEYWVLIKAVNAGQTLFQLIKVTITDANDAPSITLSTPVFIGLEENIKVVKIIPTHDPEGDNLTFSLSEVDYKLFEITQDGTLSFKDEYIPNFEKPRNSEGVVDINAGVSYLVRIHVTDPSGLRSVGTLIAIVISDVNEAPVITLNNSEPEYPLNILENRQFVVEVTATDEDEGDSITYSLSEQPADAFLFNITQSGILIFKPEFIPDYEMPRNSEGVIDTSLDQFYFVKVKVTDNDGLTDTQLIKVNILDDVSDNAMSNKDFEKIGLSVWPNPTRDIINITVKEKADYRLLNIRGQVLKIGNLTSGESKIDVSPLAKGVYFLNFKTISGSFTMKVVKN